MDAKTRRLKWNRLVVQSRTTKATYEAVRQPHPASCKDSFRFLEYISTPPKISLFIAGI